MPKVFSDASDFWLHLETEIIFTRCLGKILVGESEFSDHGYYVSVEAHMFALDYVTSGYVDADIEMS